MFSTVKLAAIGVIATLVQAATDVWSHAEIHYGSHDQIEGVSKSD